MSELFAQMLNAMYSRPDGSDGRESKDIFVVRSDTLTVKKYTGWSCAPNNPNDWWCPDYGYSVYIGESGFFTEKEAVASLRKLIAEREQENREALERIGTSL